MQLGATSNTAASADLAPAVLTDPLHTPHVVTCFAVASHAKSVVHYAALCTIASVMKLSFGGAEKLQVHNAAMVWMRVFCCWHAGKSRMG